MKSSSNNWVAMATLSACLMLSAGAAAQTAPKPEPASASASAPPETGPTVPPAKPGVYSESKQSATRFRVTIKGQTFTARDAIEKYLFYRAAMLALEQRSPRFTLVEGRSPGDTPPPPQADPSGYHYSFRMAYWRPVWRYKRTGSAAWSTWSLFSGGAFFAEGKDPKAVSDYEVSADIVMQKGPMDDRNPIAFEPRAVSEFLVNQVNPPE